MSKKLSRSGLCVAALAIGFAQPATAATGCWDHTRTAAAKIRDLQSRLMVATMRCQAAGIDILGSYNEFVTTNRATIQAANQVIRAQFTEGLGAAGEAEYDRFTTGLANAYGADATDGGVCEQTAAVAAEAVAANGDIARLIELADRSGKTPVLPGGQCPITFAAAVGK